MVEKKESGGAEDRPTMEQITAVLSVARHIHQVLWLRDLAEERVLYVNPAFERIWGRPVESLLASPQVWLESVHPEDRERVMSAALNEARAGGDVMEYRIVRPDGSVRWVRDRAYPIRDEAGRVIRLAGVAEDITSSRPPSPGGRAVGS